jgi:hypothetical protein
VSRCGTVFIGDGNAKVMVTVTRRLRHPVLVEKNIINVKIFETKEFFLENWLRNDIR